MSKKPIIWLIDTSIFLNVLDVPNFNQDRTSVLNSFKEYIENDDTFLLPYTTIVETGNHIAQLNGNHKFDFAQKFTNQVKSALNQEIPWKPLEFPTAQHLESWIDDFPNYAGQGIGFADYSLIKEWESQKEMYPAYSVRIWSLDTHLQGYES